MAFRRATLESLRCAIRWRVGVEAVKRHEDADMNGAINRAIQRFREAVSSTGEPYFLARADVAVSAGPSAGLPYRTIDLQAFASPCLRVFGLEITDAGMHTVTLQPVTFSSRNDYHDRETDRDIPVAWTHVDANTIAVMPAPDVAYNARVWYLPQLPDLVNGQDQVEVLTSGDEWIIREVALQLLERDAKPELIGVMMQERDAILGEMLQSLNKLQRVGPYVRRDTRRARSLQSWRVRLQR